MDALEIGVLRGVTGFHQRLEAALHQIHHAAAQNGLLAEEVGLGLIVEGGLHDACPGAADAGDVGQRDLVGPAGGVLLHGHQTGHALAGNIGGADSVAGALGCRHEHVHTGGRHDLLVADVEAVGKGQGVALLQIGGDILFVNVGLYLVIDEHHHDVAPLGGLGNILNGKPCGLRLGPVLGAFPQAHADLAAGVLQVQGMGMALRAVADHGDLLAVEIVQVAILFIIHLSHGKFLLFIMVLC